VYGKMEGPLVCFVSASRTAVFKTCEEEEEDFYSNHMKRRRKK
jgi:hypothetical protein